MYSSVALEYQPIAEREPSWSVIHVARCAMRSGRGAWSRENEEPPSHSTAARARGAAQVRATRVLCKLRLGLSLIGTRGRLARDPKGGH